MSDIPKVKRNIRRMVDGGATEQEIDEYLSIKKISLDQLDEPAQAAPTGFQEAQASVPGRTLQGVRDVLADAPAQLLPRGAEFLTSAGGLLPNPVSEFFKSGPMGYETIDNTLRQNEAQYQQSRKATGSTGFDLARGTGAVAGSILPVGKLARALNTTRIGKASPAIKSALVGGTADASIPVTDTNNFASEKLKQVVTGAVLGPAFDKVAGLVAPQIQSGAKKLMDMGVKVTPGQAFGGALKHVEQKVESLPLVGDLIRGGRGRGVEDFNRVVIDDSLSSLGIALPANVQSGRRAIEYAGQRISKSYNDVVEKLTSSVDEKFVNEISELAELSKNMVDSRAKQFSDILQNKLFRKVSPNGTITGESAKEIESELGTLARKFGNSPDADQQLMGDAIMQAQGIVKQLIRRSNPEAAAPLDAANAAYAKFLRVERAAGGLGAKQGETPGVFSPAQFRSSVRATDPSRNKRQFARGNALSQKLAETGEEVLGNVVPDFGTAGRGMMGAMLLGGGSGYFIDPAIAAASLAGSSIYTRPGISLVNRLLSRPSAVQVAGARARPYAPGMVPGEGRLQDEPQAPSRLARELLRR